MWPRMNTSIDRAQLTRAPRGTKVTLTQAQTRRGDLRLDQDRSRLAQDQASRAEASRLDVHLRTGGLQPGSVAESHARGCLRGPEGLAKPLKAAPADGNSASKHENRPSSLLAERFFRSLLGTGQGAP